VCGPAPKAFGAVGSQRVANPLGAQILSLQVCVPNGAVFQQSPRERRIRECGGRREWGEDYYRLMESAAAGRSDLIARTKAGLCVEDAANTNS